MIKKKKNRAHLFLLRPLDGAARCSKRSDSRHQPEPLTRLLLGTATGISGLICVFPVFFFSSRRRHTRLQGDWSSDVCSSDLLPALFERLLPLLVFLLLQ